MNHNDLQDSKNMDTNKLSNVDQAEHALPSNKKFGLFFAALFFAFCIIFFTLKSIVYGLIFLTLATFFLLATLFNDSLLTPLNILWAKLGLFLGSIISPIILALIFFGIFTTTSLILRILGRDELLLKPTDSATFWRARTLSKKDPYNLEEQF